MSFWKSVGSLALDLGKSVVKEASHGAIDFDKGVSRSLTDFNNQGEEYKDEMRDKNDDYLLQVVRNDRNSSNFSKKYRASAAYAELKSRGYTAEDIF